MYPQIPYDFPPVLRALPLLLAEVGPDGVVRRASDAFLRELTEPSLGRPLAELLGSTEAAELLASAVKAPMAGEGANRVVVLPMGRSGRRVAFEVVPDSADGGSCWIVERSSGAPEASSFEDLSLVREHLARVQRQLTGKTRRLARVLDELERKLLENDDLSQQLQQHNEEAEVQSEELLEMTEELHRGQETLLQLQQQLERRTRELQVALTGRSRFYASMSHELRTPVNAVMGYNDLLLAGVYGELNEHQELAVERSQKAVRHLRELINDVLDISRIESGRIEIEVETIHLPELLEDLVATVEPLADAQGSQLHLSADVPEMVTTDPRRLRQILLNLLSNAIRFAGGHPIWLRAEATALGVTVEVVDNGPGMEAAEIAAIFDEFAPAGDEAQAVGTGLGLAVARRLSRLLGGELEASSTAGEGTTFRLRLPRASPAQKPDQ
jgi:signal transduction histidine kinase